LFYYPIVCKDETKKVIKQPLLPSKRRRPPHPEKGSDSLLINLDIEDSGLLTTGREQAYGTVVQLQSKEGMLFVILMMCPCTIYFT